VKAAFEAADADLLSLMVGPLYGNKPEIGVRELLQNSVDACRELQDFLQQRPEFPKPDWVDLNGDVTITLREEPEKKAGWFEIVDRGIGMTADVVRNYFLRAGASFRRSDAWRDLHETALGKARVMRSGRFGVGVLASFLLGDVVEVSTRHVEAAPDEGIAFKATVDAEEIELLRCTRGVGTTIRIKITRSEIWSALVPGVPDNMSDTGDYPRWDWYCLKEPKLVRVLQTLDQNRALKQQVSLPLPHSSLSDGWLRVAHKDFSDIQCTYESVPRLTCNGIRVVEPRIRGPWQYYNEQTIEPLWQSQGQFLRLECPNLSVFDPDGHLPLLLQRDGLKTPRYPFHENITEEVTRDLIAFILVNAPQGPISEPLCVDAYGVWYTGFWTDPCRWLPFFCLANGSSFLDESHLGAIRDRALLLPSTKSMTTLLAGTEVNRPYNVLPFLVGEGTQEQRAWFRFALGRTFDTQFLPTHDFRPIGARMLIRKRKYLEFRQPGLIASFYWTSIKEQFANKDWVLLQSGKCPEVSSAVNFEALAKTDDEALDGLCEWYIADEPSARTTRLGKAWQELVGSPVIPFGMPDRKALFSSEFDRLHAYIEKHEAARQRLKSKTRPG